ncbi:hypothetical protein QOZ80_4AG0319650 [Eleusine coracana subsp. coracana]|nr:hypothetical protein QOZ80_4AG0319650 [Eleusine coracana subsp. coracana]
MDYSMKGSSKDSYSPQVHNLYPDVQPTVYPPPVNPQAQGYQYQTYFGEEDPSYGWPENRPFQHGFQEDPDCITFLRGCFFGLCCCCLLGQCCI